MDTLASTVAPHLPPGPRGYPFIGALPKLRRDPLGFLLQATYDYGDVVSLGKVGLRRVFLVSHPDDIKYILLTNHRNFGMGLNLRLFDLLGRDNLAMLDGDPWRPRRKLLQPLFRVSQLHQYVPRISDAIDGMLSRWQGAASARRPVNIVREMMGLTYDVILRCMFSSASAGDDVAFSASVRTILDYLGHRLWFPWRVPVAVPTQANRRFVLARQHVEKVVKRILTAPASPWGIDLLSRLRSAEEELGRPLTEKQLHDEVVAFLIAGHESTALGLSWTFYLIARHANVVLAMKEELHRVLGNRLPCSEDLPQLTYTRQVIEESLRLYPPGWALSRSPRQDDEIGGYLIPAKSIVMLSPYVTHRRPDFWPNPDVFDPTRFAPAQASERTRFAYLPFGGGPYMCIAASFALTEMQLVLASVFQRFALDLVPQQRITPAAAFTLRPSPAIQMYLTSAAL